MEDLKNRVGEIIKILRREYSAAKTALKFRSPHQMLVSTILSAQCTDKRVNKVTKDLFKKYRIVEDYTKANLEEFQQDIRSTGFYRNKAKNIINASKKIIEEYNGKVPDNMDELVKLPGVFRKTANVVLSSSFGKSEGIVVDTHVMRLSQRLGLTNQKNPGKIEKDLMGIIPKKEWINISYRLISHGRNICTARSPKCDKCSLSKLCPSALSNSKTNLKTGYFLRRKGHKIL